MTTFQEFLGTASGTSETPVQGVVDRSLGQAFEAVGEATELALDVRDRNLVNEFTENINTEITPQEQEVINGFAQDVGNIEQAQQQGRFRGDPRIAVSQRLQRAISDTPHLRTEFEQAANRFLKRPDVSADVRRMEQRDRFTDTVINSAINENPAIAITYDLTDPIQRQEVVAQYARQQAEDQRIEQGQVQFASEIVASSAQRLEPTLLKITSARTEQDRVQLTESLEQQRVLEKNRVTQTILRQYPQMLNELDGVLAQIDANYNTATSFLGNTNTAYKQGVETAMNRLRVAAPDSLRMFELTKDTFGEQFTLSVAQASGAVSQLSSLAESAAGDVLTLAGIEDITRLGTGSESIEQVGVRNIGGMYSQAQTGYNRSQPTTMSNEQATATIRSLREIYRGINLNPTEEDTLNAATDISTNTFRAQYQQFKQKVVAGEISQFADQTLGLISNATSALRRDILATRGIEEGDLSVDPETGRVQLDVFATMDRTLLDRISTATGMPSGLRGRPVPSEFVEELPVRFRRFWRLSDTERNQVFDNVTKLNNLMDTAKLVLPDSSINLPFEDIVGVSVPVETTNDNQDVDFVEPVIGEEQTETESE